MDLGLPGSPAEPTAAGNGMMKAELAHPVSASEEAAAPADEIAAAPAADAAKPAARWDKESDIVRLDWPEIERTAAEHGPNQVMAKLLIAARAEGANSRWPL